MSGLLIAIPLLPLLAAVASLWFGRKLRWHGGELVAGVTAVVCMLLPLVARNLPALVQGTWFESGGLRLTVGLELNGVTWFAAIVVAGVSFFVSLYALGYMRDEAHAPRFFAELGLFIGAMLTLVLASSLVLLFMAWETVGIASFLLIGFRYEDPQAHRAATKAFVMTRIGDVGFLLAWLLVLAALRTTDIPVLLSAVQRGGLSEGMTVTVGGLLFTAVVGKSAQLPLTAWLPDAMLAPTPISALLHSATMVAAGVFLLLRLYPLFAAAPVVLQVIFWFGAITAVFTALVATGEMDLKRILAWSTSSHLGEMLLVFGLGGPLAAALQFASHASFKSALLLCAGMVEKRTGTRDLHRLRGLRHVLPGTTLAFALSALALTGLQPLLFSSSEDTLLATALATSRPAAILVLVILLFGGIYIARAGVVVFSGDWPKDEGSGGGATRDERNRPMLVGMLTLALIATFGAVLLQWAWRILPFGAEPSLPWPWRIAGILTAMAGLGSGAGYAWRYRAAPIFRGVPEALAGGLVWATAAPARVTEGTACIVQRLEGWLDGLARTLTNFICLLAKISERLEGWLDRVAGTLTAFVCLLANMSDRLEQQEFGAGTDRMADALQWAGEKLRCLETGKLYLYTLSLFIGAVIVVVGTVFAADLATGSAVAGR